MSHFNIYCDESCHLENDHQECMVLGSIWCPVDKTKEISKRIRDFKENNGLDRNFEIKWTKVSNGNIKFYLNLVDYFFDIDHLHFRVLIVTDKSTLDHTAFNQTHDDWYYKMYFDMLKAILSTEFTYRIYLDVKDTLGARKVVKLKNVLCKSIYDFSGDIIERVQLVRSHEIELMQLADLLIGAVSYVNRNLSTSDAKLQIVRRIQDLSGFSLKKTTLLREEKVNIFIWTGKGENNLLKTQIGFLTCSIWTVSGVSF